MLKATAAAFAKTLAQAEILDSMTFVLGRFSSMAAPKISSNDKHGAAWKQECEVPGARLHHRPRHTPRLAHRIVDLCSVMGGGFP